MAEMSIKKKRPKNLDLTTIRLPLPGKVSILHRVSGAGLFLCIPVILWLFGASLESPEGFASFQSIADMLLVKVILAGLILFQSQGQMIRTPWQKQELWSELVMA